MIRLFALYLFFLCQFQGQLSAQKNFWDSKDAYLGQKKPGDEPVVFAPGLLTDSGYWAGSRIAFTADGKQFIYGTNRNWLDGKNQKVLYIRFDGNKWQSRKLLFRYFGEPTLDTDQKTLFLTGRNGAIFKTQWSDTGWSRPKEFLHRSYALYNFMPTLSGHYYVASNGTWGNKTDFNSWKFSVLTGVGSDSSIRNLGAPLNSKGFNGDFYVAPDESFVIISARESPTFESELFISFKKTAQTWSVPVSLGPLINNGPARRWGAYISPDRKFLFYTQGTSDQDCHIYWVRFDRLLQKLRKEQTP